MQELQIYIIGLRPNEVSHKILQFVFLIMNHDKHDTWITWIKCVLSCCCSNVKISLDTKWQAIASLQ